MSTEGRGTDLLIRELCLAILDEASLSRGSRRELRVTGLGRHFAILAEEARRLERSEETEVISYLEKIEEEWERPWLADTDKTWRPLHHSLLTGPSPLSYAILGGRPLTNGQRYLTRLVTPEQVRQTSGALAEVEEAWLRERLSQLGLRGELRWMWESLTEVRDLFALASATDRAVLFTADA
ncbi:DUF1877 family protein [Streptomyces albipurpureus]|uniref:YfbM family protein n=1 Tax=Streptomyces albipurpureus TaxID=2897419 RepID=A0ABT0UT36_9ACTN|nr:DUF1877 family protein [Streptomyces sp. CWNU-1]MCM2391401.1 YfbM family protein [Streptomyces sp. CWNU-1]